MQSFKQSCSARQSIYVFCYSLIKPSVPRSWNNFFMHRRCPHVTHTQTATATKIWSWKRFPALVFVSVFHVQHEAEDTDTALCRWGLRTGNAERAVRPTHHQRFFLKLNLRRNNNKCIIAPFNSLFLVPPNCPSSQAEHWHARWWMELCAGCKQGCRFTSTHRSAGQEQGLRMKPAETGQRCSPDQTREAVNPFLNSNCKEIYWKKRKSFFCWSP